MVATKIKIIVSKVPRINPIKSGPSPKDASPIEYSSIRSVAKTASVCENEKKFLEEMQNNFQPKNKNKFLPTEILKS